MYIYIIMDLLNDDKKNAKTRHIILSVVLFITCMKMPEKVE